MSNFLEDGFLLLRDPAVKEAVLEVFAELSQALSEVAGESGEFDSLYSKVLEKRHPFDLQNRLHLLVDKSKTKQILAGGKTFETLKELLGPDLDYIVDGFFNIAGGDIGHHIINKRPHQEVWSGAGPNEARVWAHISPGEGPGLEVARGSHLYGLIPNRDREPLPDQPVEFNFESLPTRQGDVLVFHPLLLHKTAPQTNGFRVAFTTGVRSAQRQFEGMQKHFNWGILHRSPISMVEKRLGNPYLSPYRILNEGFNHRSPGDGYLDF